MLLAYLEFLSESNISNGIAALRALHIMCGEPTLAFKDYRIPLFLMSLKLNKPFDPKIAPVISTALLIEVHDL